MTQAPMAMSWQVNGLQLAGLSWGDPGAKPLLALHGWLDNAASFSVLAPLLKHHHVVAVDLTGHGLSAHRSADAGYQIWEDLPELLGVLDALGWQEFSLMGHSRGAIIAGLLASTLPERVQRLVFGACDPKSGAVTTCVRGFDLPGLNHRVESTGGVMADACGDILKQFFLRRRG